jgi:hypothetical protein
MPFPSEKSLPSNPVTRVLRVREQVQGVIVLIN